MEVMSYKDESQNNENNSVDKRSLWNEEENSDQNQNIIPSSLLALLDDKNKSILLLKQQLHNQKLQLGFYLHKVLHSPKISDLADTSIPYEAEENLQINLALTKFCKQNGLQSRIMKLHDRMTTMELNASSLLLKQEEMVHTIITKIAEFTRNNVESNVKNIVSKMNNEDHLVNTLAKILGSLNKLRKELGYFKNATNRLVIIENERNNLVDKVYSMPAPKRLNYGAILASNYEKLRLEQEVSEIKEQQKLLQERLSQFPTVFDNYDENLTAVSLPVSHRTDIHKMLETVNTEAVSLLATTKDQKDKYVNEISKLKESNTILGEEVNSMNHIKLAKEELEVHLEEAKVEVEKIKKQNESSFDEMNIKLQSMAEEREFLQNKLQNYYNLEEQLQLLQSKAEDAEIIKQQRDYYKSQVEDLQAIRAAYAQLVQHCPIKTEDSMPTAKVEEMLSKVRVLENQKEMMNTEMKTLGEIITDQEVQIKHLLMVIKEMAQQPELSKHTTVSNVTQTETQVNYGESKNVGLCEASPFDSDNRSAYSQTDNDSEIRTMLKEVVSILLKSSECDSRSSTNQVSSSALPIEKSSEPNVEMARNKSAHEFAVLRSSNTDKTDTEVVYSSQDENKLSRIPRPRGKIFATHPKELMQSNSSWQSAQLCSCDCCPIDTTVEIKTINQHGRSESMKAVFKNSQAVESLIQLNDSFSIRLTCINPNRNIISKPPLVVSPIVSERELKNSFLSEDELKIPVSSKDMDEFELMKDSSNEAMVVPSIYKRGGCFSIHCVGSSQVKDSGGSCSLTELKRTTVFPIKNEVEIGNEAQPKITETVLEEEQDLVQFETDSDQMIAEGGDMKDEISITTRLKKITSEIGYTLSQPDGKETLLNAVKTMYGTLFTDFNNQQVGR